MTFSRKVLGALALGATLGTCALLASTLPIAAPAQAQQSAPAPASVHITEVSAGGLRSAINRHRGKVVVVNFWATWCSPCVAELPELAKLARNNANRGVVVLLVSADQPEDRDNVRRVLAQRGHRSTTLIQGDLSRFMEAFDPNDKRAIALPSTYVFNRQGRQVALVRGESKTLPEFQRLIEPHLR